jgi:hypothetical protein
MKKISSALIVSIILCLVFSCKDTQEKGYMGPAIVAAGANFKVVTPLTAPPLIAFATNPGSPACFTATFNQTVTWQLTIAGDTSAATKTITGTGSVMNACWDGSHDGTYYFEDKESGVATLNVTGWDSVYKVPFKILAAKPMGSTDIAGAGWINPGTAYMPATSAMTFEVTGATYPSKFIGSSLFQYSAFDVGSTYQEAEIVRQTDSIRAPEGKYFLRISGRFINPTAEPNGVFIDGVQGRTNWGVNTPHILPKAWYTDTIIDPTKVYLNIWVRGIDHLPPGFSPYATVNVEVDEDDNGQIANGTLPDGNPKLPVNCNQTTGDNWCPCNEDGWFLKIPVRHQGWKLFSCRYSDLLQDEDGLNGGDGNRIMEPHKVIRVQIGMNATVPWSNIQCDVDMFCFTYGGPLNPNSPY